MDTRITQPMPNAAPVVPGGAPANAVPAAPAGAPQANGPAINADAANANAAMQWQLTDVNLENIDIQEFKALDGMLQNFLQDGKITAEEWKTYDKTRVFYAEGGKATPPAGGGHPPETPAPVGGGTPPVDEKPKDAWSYTDKPINGRGFSSVGDPHETTGDGLKFDNMEVGDFVKLQSASGDFVLQTRQEPYVKNPRATVNTAAAVKMGNDTVAYDGHKNQITVNGQPVQLKPGEEMKLPGGGVVKATKDGVEMVSAKGDKVSISDRGGHIDVRGEVGPNRKDGEIRGSLGAFDNDTDKSNELLGRTSDKNFGKDLQGFFDEWRVKGGEGLIPGDPPGGGRRDEMEAAAVKQDLADFEKADITKGGWLSGTELKGYEHYDVDGNGEVSKAEFLKARAAERELGKEFMLKDMNADDILDGVEMKGLEKYDVDGNGRLTKEEYVRGRLAEKMKEMKDPVAPVGGGGAPAPAPAPKPMDAFQTLNWLMANWASVAGRNNRVSKKEIEEKVPDGPGKQALLKHFDKLIFASADGGNSAWRNLTRKDVDAIAKAIGKDGSIDTYASDLAQRIIKQRGIRDTNNDDQVNEADLARYVQSRGRDRGQLTTDQIMKRRDLNKDDILDGIEIPDRFKELDKNGDGRLTREELKARLRP